MIGTINIGKEEAERINKAFPVSFINITKQIPADETTDIKKIEENTDTISLTFKSRDIRMDSINYDVYCNIVRSIEVLESENVEFSEPILIKNIQNDVVPGEWDDLFAIKKYNGALNELQSNYDSEITSYDNEVDKLQQKYFMEKANKTMSIIGMLEKIIVFMTEFKRLMLEAIPDLEIQFLQKFDEYNEQQKQIAIENKNVNEHVFSDYLTFKDKSGLIEKIRDADRTTPRNIYIILRALFDNGHLVMNDNETIYKAFYAEFGYHKSYDSLKRGLNYYTFEKTDTDNWQKIDNMYEHLTS